MDRKRRVRAEAVIYRGGPGAGKTTLLRAEAREALHQGVSPPQILYLALDRVAASDAQEAWLCATEHGTAAPRVLTYDDLAREILGEGSPRFLDPLSERLLVGRALRRTAQGARHFRAPAVRESARFRDDVADFIAELKQHKVTPEQFREEIVPALPEGGALADLGAAYEHYQESLRAGRIYDLRGLLWLALEALSDPQRGRLWRERFALVLADDLQEATPLQLELLAAVAGGETRVVGTYEPAERVYGFRGALGDPRGELSRLLGREVREEQVPQGEEGPGAEIAAAAARFREREGLESNAEGRGPLPGEVVYAAYQSEEEELGAIAERILEATEAGAVGPEEIAVILRKREDAERAAEYLGLRGLPVANREGAAEWQARQVMADLVTLWQAGQGGRRPPGARRALEEAREEAGARLADLTAIEAKRGRRATRGTGAQGLGPADLEEGTWERAVARAMKQEAIPALVTLTRELLPQLPEDSWRRLAGPMAALLTQVQETGTRLEELTGQPAEAGEVQAILGGTGLRRAFPRPGLAVLTAHEARGRRFRWVFLAGLQEETFPATPPVSRLLQPDTAQALRRRMREVLGLGEGIPVFAGLGEAPEETRAEEARLFYTCMTRAEERLELSCYREAEGVEVEASPFLRATLPEPGEEVPTGRGPQRGSVPAETRARRQSDRAVVEETAEALSLSPTALEEYLNCPWRFFLTSLLRVQPREDTDRSAYGQAIHEWLRQLNALHPARRREEAEGLLEVTLEKWRERFSSPLAAEMYAGLAREAARAYAATEAMTETALLPEGTLQLTLTGPEGAQHRFEGRIDVAWLRGDGVAVVDYKTGKVETGKALRKRIPTSEEEVREGRREVQLPCYALAWEARPGARPVRAMCLQNVSAEYGCKSACVTLGEGGKPEETLSREDLGRVAGLMVAWAGEIKGRREFWPRALPEGCRGQMISCPFAEICDDAEIA